MTHPQCRQVSNSIHDYLDGEADDVTAVFIDGHLQQCPACAHLVRFEIAVRTRIRQTCSALETPPELRVRIMTRITQVVTQVRVTYRDDPDGGGSQGVPR